MMASNAQYLVVYLSLNLNRVIFVKHDATTRTNTHKETKGEKKSEFKGNILNQGWQDMHLINQPKPA